MTPAAQNRYTHIHHMPHMACHDYTNKVSYNSYKGPAKVEVTRKTAQAAGSHQKTGPAAAAAVAKPTNRSVSSVSGGGTGPSRKLNNSTRKTTRAYQEDSDYLAHGTGIPR